MKYLVISDIHGNSYYANKIDGIVDNEKPDKIIILGDLYYDYTNNYPTRDDISNKLNKYKNIILCTRGNCDNKTDEEVSDFNFFDYFRLNIGNKIFFFTHGHLYNMNNLPKDIDVIVYGHLHSSFIIKKDDVIIANPGSISVPRGNSDNSYMIIDNNSIIIKDIFGNVIDGIKYNN